MQGENYNDPNRLITPWGYIGYSILFAIPVVGLICVLVFSFSSNYPCRKNYARSILIMYIIGIIIVVIAMAMGFNFALWYQNIGLRYY